MNSDELEPGIQFVDVQKVFHQKNPRLAPLIPGFVYRFIKNIVHEDYINEFLRKHGHKQGLEFIEAIIADFNVTTEIIGEENLPPQGRFIFAGNHPLGGVRRNGPDAFSWEEISGGEVSGERYSYEPQESGTVVCAHQQAWPAWKGCSTKDG